MHLSDADLGAALDRADGSARHTAAHAHAATCSTCHGAIRKAQATDREVGDLLRLLDHPTPALDFASVRRAAGPAALAISQERQSADETAVEPRTGLRLVSRGSSAVERGIAFRSGTIMVAVRRGAIILGLSAAAVAAAALPPSVRHFVARLAGAPVAKTSASAPAVQPSVTVPTAIVPVAPVVPQGVAIMPAGPIDLVFRTSQAGGVLRIRPSSGPRVSVTASTDGPTYAVGRGSIIIDPPATPGVTYDIDLPSPTQAPDVTIRIGPRVVFARHGAVVVTQSAVAPDGSYVVALER
jgi:hypothetical protein